MQHEDSNQRCLVYHSDCVGQCIRCTCGEYVRPDRWDQHSTPGDGPDLAYTDEATYWKMKTDWTTRARDHSSGTDRRVEYP